MTALPSGIDPNPSSATSVLRTLVVSDLVDSTALVERLGDQRAAELIRRHDRFVRALMHEHAGREIDKTDGFLVMFERPIQAVAFALAYQRGLAEINAGEDANLAARVGIHVGDVVTWDNAPEDVRRGAKPVEVEGLVKPIAARLMQLALPGQILLSGVAYDIAHRAQGELGDALDGVRWRTHGRYRFKGVPEPVPVFEVGQQGFAPLKPPPWSSKAHREVPMWRRPLIVGVELLLLAALIAVPVLYLTRPAPAIAFAKRDWVVVGDLKNLTGDQVFDDSLQEAFRVGLEQSRYVNLVSDLAVRSSLKRMERPAGTKVERAVGSEIAVREGARALILPTIAEIGGRVRLTAEIVDPNTQTSVYSDSVDAAGEDSVLPAMDTLLKQMRTRFGESLASIGETSAPLADVTTKNLDALKAYSLGLQSMTDGKGREANALFQRATKLDPDFALAWLALSNIAYSTGQKPKAHEYVTTALAHTDRLSERERMVAEGYAAWFADPAEMREKWTLFAHLYPDAMTGQNNLGLVEYWYDNALEDAAKNFATVGESRHPRRGYSLMLLGNVDLALDRVDAARKAYRTAREVGSPQLNLDPVFVGLATHDAAAARAALDREETRSFPYFEAEKALRRSAIEASQGRYASARKAADEANAIATKAGLTGAPQRATLAAAAIAFAAGDKDARSMLAAFVAGEIARLDAAAATYDYSAYTHLSLAAMLATRNGDPALAARALAAEAAAAGSSGYHSVSEPYRAAVCENGISKDAKGAVACLEALVSERSYYPTRVALLRAYRAAGDDAKALAAADWLTRHRGRAVAEYLGEYAAQVPNLIAADQAEVDAAELEQAAGHRDEAKRRVADLARAWTAHEGDPPLARRIAALAEKSGSAEQEHR